jgi:hypothetical protein
MTTKLIQRHLLKGTREFELGDDHVNVRIKAPFRKEEVLTVMLTVLDPEPVISKSCLDFNSRVNGEPLISLYLGKPNTAAVNAFVRALKSQAHEAFSAFAGLRSNTGSAGLGANAHEEAPEFEESDQEEMDAVRRDLDPARIGEAIQMLNQYLEPDDTAALVAALAALEEDPGNEALVVQVVNAFHELGPRQGAVLTYAPYVGMILSEGPLKW